MATRGEPTPVPSQPGLLVGARLGALAVLTWGIATEVPPGTAPTRLAT